MAKINVKGTEIVLINQKKEDYISLTDIAKVRDSRSEVVIQNWMRTRMTIELLGFWETLYNPNFKHLEF
ncbi:MAG: KilA-N domain-containing protein, partial [Candidatus Symbiothrix sp.]|nr:KilA-N domain-containing protein [Candidatus Symbiothrix sp.]